MTFASPLLAGIAAAIAVPTLVLLYFLKLRRRTVEVSTTLLWAKAIQDLQANAPFQRLRNNILLLLQLLALALVLLALAQPELASQGETGRRLVILLDRSASMQAQEDDASRLDDAKAQAIELVNSMRDPGLLGRLGSGAVGGGGRGGGGDEAMLIVFDTAARVVLPFTSDQAALERAIDAVEATDAPSRLREAFRLAQAQRPQRIIEGQGLDIGEAFEFHLYSDGRLPDAEEALPGPEDTVVFHVVGSDAPNTGIVSLQARRAYDDPALLSVFVSVQSTNPEPTSVDVELSIDNELVSIRPVAIPAASRESGEESPPTPSSAGAVFELDMPDAALISVRLTHGRDDALGVDDTAFVAVPPAKQSRVAIVTDGNLFLSEALSGLPLATLDVFRPAEFSPERGADYDVVILDGVIPGDGDRLPPGRWLVLGEIPEPLVDLGAEGLGEIVVSSSAHPATRGLSLDSVTIGRDRAVEIPDAASVRVLAETQRGPVILDLTGDDHRAIVVTFGLLDSDWPFDPSFIIFLAQAVRELDAGERGSPDLETGVGASRAQRPGATLSTRVPEGADRVRITPPGGEPTDLFPAPDGRVVFGPSSSTGVYRLSWAGPGAPGDREADGRTVRDLAVNLEDPDESDTTPARVLTLASDEVRASDSGGGATVRRFWPYLILGALAMLMLEWWIYNRKVAI